MKSNISIIAAGFSIFGTTIALIGDGSNGAGTVVASYPLGMSNDAYVCNDNRWKVKEIKEQAKTASKFLPKADGNAPSNKPGEYPKEHNTTDETLLHGCTGLMYEWPLTKPTFSAGGTPGYDFLLLEADYNSDKVEICNVVTTVDGGHNTCVHHRSEY
ncbi:hypothetical protein DIS24_g12167 [Lasiodiplodia hormozganensis]|uniref:Uncharacterized protein n=1 Tax=Lasiodiplodia hormozganensis TaxID=869390 RepID=A0AA39TK52_9PEZI|nr:hypothetical protein DIS24_g12167 [Lasiodiplodia hormozganensis]